MSEYLRKEMTIINRIIFTRIQFSRSSLVIYIYIFFFRRNDCHMSPQPLPRMQTIPPASNDKVKPKIPLTLDLPDALTTSKSHLEYPFSSVTLKIEAKPASFLPLEAPWDRDLSRDSKCDTRVAL